MEKMKRLKLGTTYNARDIGGYPTPEGYTRKLAFIRCDNPKGFSQKDIDFLLENNITMVIDLRSSDECAQQPDILASTPGFTYIDCPMYANGEIPTHSEDIAPSYLRLAEAPDVIGPVLHAIAAAPGGVLYHCTAGKDRTGVVSALLLWTAGVDKADILADYITTQAYLLEPYRRIMRDHPDFPYYLTRADIGCIEEFYDALVQKYSRPETYLHEMGLSDGEISAIKAKLTY